MVNPESVTEYDLIGFGSGIYSSSHHKSLFDLADKLPKVDNKHTFLFSTCGMPAFAFGREAIEKYIIKAHSPLKEKLKSKGYNIIDEFVCHGFNTNSFLKLFGGINKNRPDAEDLKNAEEFARKIKENIS